MKNATTYFGKRFATSIYEGFQHTRVPSNDGYYNEANNGVRVYEWVAALLNHTFLKIL